MKIEDILKCKWSLNSKDNENVEDADLDYPKADSEFIEFLFKDDIWIPIHDYNANMVICLGLMSILPCMIIFFVALPWLCGIYTRKTYDLVLDCCENIFCCCREFIPRRVRHLPNMPNTPLNQRVSFLFVYEKILEKDLILKSRAIREVCSYLYS